MSLSYLISHHRYSHSHQQVRHVRHVPHVMAALAAALLTSATLGTAVARAQSAPQALIEVTGVKFNDLNSNGVRDPGEPGLPGWTIYIDLDNDAVPGVNDPAVVTGAAGDYDIVANIPTGTYRVREVPQAGWTQTSPAVFIVVPGEIYSDVNFGNHQTAAPAAPADVPESDTILLIGAGIGALALYAISQRRNRTARV